MVTTDVPRVGRYCTGKRSVGLLVCLVFALVFIAINLQHKGQLISITQFRKDSEVSEASTNKTYRVICMIFTTPSNWNTKGKAVLNTWAKRCHRAIFFYSKVADCSSQPICNHSSTVGLDIPEGRDHLTAKTFKALNYSFSKHAAEADYFLKADDDTYVIMENLKKMLQRFNSTTRLYLGRKIDNIVPNGYNSGGAGYTISVAAVRDMLRLKSSFPKDCPEDGTLEDVDVGKCLAAFGIYPQEDLDPTGKLTFHSDNPLDVLRGGEVAKHYYIAFSDIAFGQEKAKTTRGYMLSNSTATLHYVKPAEMYMYDFLLYRLERLTVPNNPAPKQ